MVLTAKKGAAEKWNISTYELLDIGQTGSPKEKEAYEFTARRNTWRKNKPKDGWVIFKYAAIPDNQYKEEDRKIIECFLREKHGPLKCGTNFNADFNRHNAVKILNSGKYKPLKDKYLA
jgi:hypothetical protein